MFDKITLDILSQDSVSLKKQQYATADGTEFPVGQPWRRAYVNSASGRAQAQTEVPEPYRTAIFVVWGDSPTVDETVE